MHKLPVSVFIIAVNEGDRIGNTIKSVSDWVEEVIVVDSGSTDDTIAVCEHLGAKVFRNAWLGYGLQKRFGEDKCKNDWILNLDADEVISEELREEILSLFSVGTPAHPAWRMRIVEILPGRRKPILFAHKIVAIRLYNKQFGRFSDSSVHDTVRMEKGSVGELHHIIEHRSSRGFTHTLDKINRYSTMQAKDLLTKKQPLPFARLRLVVEFPANFIKAYIFRGYILGGTQGFANSIVYAFSRFIRIAKYLEKKQK